MSSVQCCLEVVQCLVSILVGDSQQIDVSSSLRSSPREQYATILVYYLLVCMHSLYEYYCCFWSILRVQCRMPMHDDRPAHIWTCCTSIHLLWSSAGCALEGPPAAMGRLHSEAVTNEKALTKYLQPSPTVWSRKDRGTDGAFLPSLYSDRC